RGLLTENMWLAFCLFTLWFSVAGHCLPLRDSGPLISNGWDKPVRFRHLYAANRQGLASYHLQINEDGRVEGAPHQTSFSLLEIRPVSTGCVAFRGVKSSHYLCMNKDGKLRGLEDDCSFIRAHLPNGYSLYTSEKHKAVVSLSGTKPPVLFPREEHSPFIPVLTYDQSSVAESRFPSYPETDSMDPFCSCSPFFEN
uniref:Fibroblast growth factor n=1 Tax=Erpetoichthys calabaricus TaxID=27687 RepID=A0A8C4SQZ0_ERPCA